MNALRILLLVVLAVLLPVRGALAGGAHCAGSSNQPVQALVAHSHAHAHADPAHGHTGPADAVHAAHHDPAPASGEQAAGSLEPCGLCTASCSSTAFLSEPLPAAAFVSPAAAVFPALPAPAPSHASDGPERPPRSL